MDSGLSPPALPLWRLIEEIRLQNGWSRTKIAQQAGVARTTLNQWKRQPRTPLVPTVIDVADRLGIDRVEALRLAGIAVRGQADPAMEPDENPHDRMDRLYRAYKDDPERGPILRGILESWDRPA